MTTNKNVYTSAILIARETETGATLKVGAILIDTTLDSEFILLRHDLDYSRFQDPKFQNGFIKLRVVSKEDFGNEW